jgi:mono/diheme cytochrome c family protein
MHVSTYFIPFLLCGVISGAALSGARAQEKPPEAAPPEITDSLILAGKQVYWGGGSDCVSCHGLNGRGTDRAPSLSDDEWIHGDGSYPEIVKLVTHGVSAEESETGKEMPSRGLAHTASDDDIRALAAYVWSLSKKQ